MPRPGPARRTTEPPRTNRASATEQASPAFARPVGSSKPPPSRRQRGVPRTRQSDSAASPAQRQTATGQNRPANRPSPAAEPSSGPRAATVGPGPRGAAESLYAAPVASPKFQHYLDRATNPGQYCERCGNEMDIPENIKSRRINKKRFCSATCRKAQYRIDKRIEQAVKATPRGARSPSYFSRGT